MAYLMQDYFPDPEATAATNCVPVSTEPSAAIDAAICDLIQRIVGFTNADFDATWFSLSDAEIEGLVVLLLQDLRARLDGKKLSGYLLTLRANPMSTAVSQDGIR